MEQIAEKKKAILESTLDLIREKGFHGTPMSLVAKNAGVAAGTIYHYFDSKDKLICEVFTYIMDNMMEAVKQHDKEEMTYQARFFNVWRSQLRFYLENPKVLVFFEQFVNSPYNELIGHNRHDKLRQHLKLFLSNGVEAGYLRRVNPEVLSVLVLTNVITTAKMIRRGEINQESPEIEQIAEILWKGISL
ncbi:TetR family transcriptional regulator [Pontibacter ummariensis]|uniref:Transcriptional regulator, TetR family n=1 Tax=Pontibacter ummariensis TaxID=1610492 RepID=A0A239FMN1_9BACT|nr:TetR/AcrR family transcriptional regulator [Pontibacter ummariensis]PRY12005.1 TetR family transcriptional regulator [Pontibacter ummariensis]SNS58081.1 transcriptional regulator, TetR family [Pontibacter ummariensis]